MLIDETIWDEMLLYGTRGRDVLRLQEWLVYHGAKIRIDGDFGPETKKAVKESGVFRTADVLMPEELYELSRPILEVQMAPKGPPPVTYADAVMRVAQQHLAALPVEIGGPNAGPWVRSYMRGNEGVKFPWCAGFVSTVLAQASVWAPHLDVYGRMGYTMSCDALAKQAIKMNRFRSGNIFKKEAPAIFLVRKSRHDWTHTGFGFNFGDMSFETIEGNTNVAGSREGVAVLKRSRGYAETDFILL